MFYEECTIEEVLAYRELENENTMGRRFAIGRRILPS